MNRSTSILAGTALACTLAGAAAAQDSDAEAGGPDAAASNYGCTGLATADPMAVLEGRDGVFYRLNLDMRMSHPLSAGAAEAVGRLAEALAQRGTRLVYLPVPTKSLALPDHLPDSAATYGYETRLADAAYQDFLGKLEGAGIAAVDAVAALREAGQGAELPFIASDFHWSAEGARAAARAVAERLEALPGMAELPRTEHVTRATDPVSIASPMRRQIQPYCAESLPQARTQGFVTEAAGQADSGGGIFADAESAPPISLVGTSMSAEPAFNFAGFLAEAAEMEVANYAITGGNQYGSLTSYLLSEDFRAAPPDVIVWENPIYNNLGEFGEEPLLELIAAVRDECSPVETEILADGTLAADLAPGALGPDTAIRADSGEATGRQATFTFRAGDATVVESTIIRPDRYEQTRWFYKALAPLRRTDFTHVEVSFDQAATDDASLAICETESTQS
ncbi:alginate O-acetyltransferase AlgX-related protein [Roseivivax sp. CAU 1761]